MGRQMDANPDYRQLYLRLLTDPHAIRHYLNLKLAISTDESQEAPDSTKPPLAIAFP